MYQIVIDCVYHTAENPKGMTKVVPLNFMVEINLDDDGEVHSWQVDDRTNCFYTELAKFDANEIVFEGSEIEGQTGSLAINRDQSTFVQKSDMNGEWLILRGVCTEN